MAYHGPSYGLSRECQMKRENLELFLKGCEKYGLKAQDLFQVNDLYENKNLYMAQKQGFKGPVVGVKVAKENRRNFSEEQLKESHRIIGLQYGSNKGASQAGMTAYGTGRQIIPGEAQKDISHESHKIIGLQSGSNKGASQAGMTPYGAARQILPDYHRRRE